MVIFVAFGAEAKEKVAKSYPYITEASVSEVVDGLKSKYSSSAERVEKGVKQVAKLWIEGDGDQSEFKEFCDKYFVAERAELDKLSKYLSHKFETISGNIYRIYKDLSYPMEVDTGDVTPMDELFSKYDVGEKEKEGYFNSKVAFVVALNYIHYDREEQRELGKNWGKQEWDDAFIADMFDSRPNMPEEQGKGKKKKEKSTELAGMEKVETTPYYTDKCRVKLTSIENKAGERTFDKDIMLLYHWKMRDEIRMLYGMKGDKYVAQQDAIYEAMKRMIEQTIPNQLINSEEDYSWNPYTNKITKDGKEVEAESTENERYAMMRNLFIRSYKEEPDGDTYLNKRFGDSYDLTYKEVDSMFVRLISAPEAKEVGELMKQRLGRDLRPYDVWYTGFNPRGLFNAQELDAKIKALYPTPLAFEKAIPTILGRLGYSEENAKFYGDKITVNPARANGHAEPAGIHGDNSRLRTNFYADGLDYGGYQTGMHELGHTVQQTISTYIIENYARRGLPNAAISESAAYTFEFRAWKGLMDFENQAEIDNLNALDKFWVAFEMTGMALCELRTWEWMYQQKVFTTEQLKDQMIAIAKDIWNSYHAPIFGIKDEPILAVYNHQLNSSFYLAGYALAHLVHIQIEQFIEGKDFPTMIEQIYGFGDATPDLWLQNTIGSSLSVDAVIDFGRKTIDNMK